MRKSIWVLAGSLPVVAFALCVGAVLVPRAASAGECRDACAAAKKTCVLAGKTAWQSCKEDCRAAGSPDGCRRACREAFKSARHTCKGALAECRDACSVPRPPCIEGCTADLRSCLNGVHDRGRACGSGCMARARSEARDCRGNPAPLRCFGEVGRRLGACLHGCAHDVRAGVGGCTDDFRECREDQCGGYGSASRAFLDPPVDLLQ